MITIKKENSYGISAIVAIVAIVAIFNLSSSKITTTTDSSLEKENLAGESFRSLNRGKWVEQAKLTASDAASSDRFGFSVSIDGDYAIMGAHGDDIVDGGISSGAAYIFKRNNGDWVEQAKLTASDAEINDQFGYSVSINEDYAIIGAYGDSTSQGSAYIFKRNNSGGWVEQAKLTASDAESNSRFGWSVSISGDYAIIGAYRDSDNGTYSGSAYIFEKPDDGWSNTTETIKLTASDASSGDLLGWSVSISGDYAIIGASGDYQERGSAYIFKRNNSGGWVEQAKLTAEYGHIRDKFGYSVSINEDYAIIGAYGNNLPAGILVNSGSAYIFEKPDDGWSSNSGWMTETINMNASDAASNDYFGYSVSISGNYAVIGARGDDDDGGASGSAYIFKRNNGDWVEQDKLISHDASSGDWLGFSVSISGDYAIIGAYRDSDNGTFSGSAYIFKKTKIPIIMLENIR